MLSMSTPRMCAAVVAAERVEWAVNVEVSIPAPRSVAFTHLASVSFDAFRKGFRVVIKSSPCGGLCAWVRDVYVCKAIIGQRR